MSAPTPSTRFPHSEITPVVMPTIISTKMTWMEMATMLSMLRIGRATMLPTNIFTSENGPSYVSLMQEIPTHTVTSLFFYEQRWFARVQHASRQSSRTIFQFFKDFNTSVDKFVEIAAFPLVTRFSSIVFTALHYFCATTHPFVFHSAQAQKKAASISSRQLLALVLLQYHFGGRSR